MKRLAIVWVISMTCCLGTALADTEENCIKLTSEKEKSIDDVIEKITVYLNKMQEELDDIDIRLVKVDIDKHSDQEKEEKDLKLKISVNDCGDDDSSTKKRKHRRKHRKHVTEVNDITKGETTETPITENTVENQVTTESSVTEDNIKDSTVQSSTQETVDVTKTIKTISQKETETQEANNPKQQRHHQRRKHRKRPVHAEDNTDTSHGISEGTSSIIHDTKSNSSALHHKRKYQHRPKHSNHVPNDSNSTKSIVPNTSVDALSASASTSDSRSENSKVEDTDATITNVESTTKVSNERSETTVKDELPDKSDSIPENVQETITDSKIETIITNDESVITEKAITDNVIKTTDNITNKNEDHINKNKQHKNKHPHIENDDLRESTTQKSDLDDIIINNKNENDIFKRLATFVEGFFSKANINREPEQKQKIINHDPDVITPEDTIGAFIEEPINPTETEPDQVVMKYDDNDKVFPDETQKPAKTKHHHNHLNNLTTDNKITIARINDLNDSDIVYIIENEPKNTSLNNSPQFQNKEDQVVANGGSITNVNNDTDSNETAVQEKTISKEKKHHHHRNKHNKLNINDSTETSTTINNEITNIVTTTISSLIDSTISADSKQQKNDKETGQEITIAESTTVINEVTATDSKGSEIIRKEETAQNERKHRHYKRHHNLADSVVNDNMNTNDSKQEKNDEETGRDITKQESTIAINEVTGNKSNETVLNDRIPKRRKHHHHTKHHGTADSGLNTSGDSKNKNEEAEVTNKFTTNVNHVKATDNTTNETIKESVPKETKSNENHISNNMLKSEETSNRNKETNINVATSESNEAAKAHRKQRKRNNDDVKDNNDGQMRRRHHKRNHMHFNIDDFKKFIEADDSLHEKCVCIHGLDPFM